MELASTENGEKAGRNSSKQVQEENEGETDKRLNDGVAGGEKKPPEDKTEKNGDKNQASSPSQAKPQPYRPHPPPNKHMMHPPNGYPPPPHGYPPYPPHMYYPQQMPYYPGGKFTSFPLPFLLQTTPSKHPSCLSPPLLFISPPSLSNPLQIHPWDGTP